MTESFTNKKISELLRKVAAAYTIKDEDKYRFQIIAYQRAADSVEHASSEIKDLWDEGKLSEIAGIGPSIEAHLDELFKKGRVKHFQEIFEGLPEAMFEMLKIPGVGPKTAFKLCKELKIYQKKDAILKLEEAIKLGKIRNIEGFGEVSEEKILKGIQELSRKTERILLPIASKIALEVIDYLEKNKSVLRADPLGSLRRQCSTIGDIDIAVASDNPKEVIEHFKKFPNKVRMLEAGERTASLIHSHGYQVDLMIQPPSAYGALLQHFTGSKHHNIKLREIALKKGYSLSEYGIRTVKKGEKLEIGSEKEERPKGKLIEFATEEEFYNFLGMEWIPPELREDTGEIEASLSRSLPRLVEMKDIKGDLHLHSNFPIEPSHDIGENSPEEIIQKAGSLGYEYVAFTEHNPSVSQHSVPQILSLLRRKKEYIEQLNSSRVNNISIKAINGLEIDIKPDGNLAIPVEGFKYLDFAIVSVHTSLRLTRNK
jgi:DNA polymerase (family 10)